MATPRPCGCKGVRTCLLCESEFGVTKRNYLTNEKSTSFVYCVYCKKAWEGCDTNVWEEHPNHLGNSISFPGIYIELDFLTLEEQSRLIGGIDGVPWDLSQSGRRKQNYGPKCNFKRKKIKPGDFHGFPKFSEFVQKRFLDVSLLEGFRSVEQCSLEYLAERGASIDPHIDDCWVWGERVVTVNIIGDSILTLNRYLGPHSKYNLADVQSYPRVVGEDDKVIWNPFYSSSRDSGNEESQESKDPEAGNILPHDNSAMEVSAVSCNFDVDGNDALIIRVPMPARSLLVMYGTARYGWEHSVLREDITGRRVCVAYREFTPPFLKGGPREDVGLEILQRAAKFW